MFSVVNAVLLTSLPFGDPARLVVIWKTAVETKTDQNPESVPNLQDIQSQNTAFEHIAAVRSQPMIFDDGNEPERQTGARVSTNFLTVLGVRQILGRDFAIDEDQSTAQPVVIISNALWQSRYGGRNDTVGKNVVIDGKAHTIIGVLPAGIYYPSADMNLYVPLVLRPAEINRGQAFLRLLGKLKPNVTLTQARAEFDTIASRLAQQYPDVNKGATYNLVSLHEQVVGNLSTSLLVLWGAVGLVLLIACANVANLLLAKASARRAELAIKTALGATRMHLLRQSLIESLFLSLVGGLLGLILGSIFVRIFVNTVGSNIPRVENVGLNLRVLAFTMGVSFITGIMFGVIPAVRSSRVNAVEAVNESRRGTTGGVLHQRLLSALVVSEIAIAFVLLVGAGLLARSFAALKQEDAGINPHGVISMGVGVPLTGYPDVMKQARFYDRVATEIRSSEPDIDSVAIVNRLPIIGGISSTTFIIEAQPVSPADAPSIDYRTTTQDFFSVMGIKIQNGRDFNIREMGDAPDVAIINEKLARRFFPNQSPLGQRIQIFPFTNKWREIVGVVGDVKLSGMDIEANPTVYVPLSQNPYPNALRNAFLVVRTKHGESASVVTAIRGLVRSLDRGVPISQGQSMEKIISDSLGQRRFSVMLFVVFAVLATLLAFVGIYGVMAYVVAQRTQEIGIRMSVGAGAIDILKMVVGDGAKLAAAGIGIGVVAAFGLTRFMRSLLFGVGATDPVTFALIVLLVLVVALVACIVPARKAAAVDPLIALKG
jgi:putative ABC transport system permease protein